MRFVPTAALLALTLALAHPAQAQRNVVIFVADGLRYASVTPETAPTMARLRKEGVDFTNSHAAYPTLTTVNAAVIATGHYPGDTGNFGNTLYTGFPVPCQSGAVVVFIQDDCTLRDIKDHYPTDYVGQTTIAEAARAAGMNTVVIGKRGAVGIQFLAAMASSNKGVDGPLGIFVDDSTNRPVNPDGTPSKSTVFTGGIGAEVKKATGSESPPMSAVPNFPQQAYLQQTVTEVVIPRLKDSGKPFLMLYWSRDPDSTQHGAVDSDGQLQPGINSITPRMAIYNADLNLKAIMESLKLHGLDKTTDVIVVADHGFATVAHGIPTPDGEMQRSSLPNGFLATDVSRWLGDKLFDPNRANAEVDIESGEFSSNGLVGPSPEALRAIVVANGGSDLIHVPEGPARRADAKRIFDGLLKAPYTGALFVDDDLLKSGDPKDFAGALPLSDVGLLGSSKMPRPTIVVGFRTFVIKGCQLAPELCTAEINDTNLHTGQGSHGTFSRADTRNFMAAIGPSFKKKFTDPAPVGNVDVAHTAARILGLKLSGAGNLTGRVMEEALAGGTVPKFASRIVASEKASNGVQTLLNVQEVGETKYFTAAGIPGRTVGLKEK